jgi:hypothetical protein
MSISPSQPPGGYRAILKVIKRAIANDRSIISGKAEEFSLPISRPMRE